MNTSYFYLREIRSGGSSHRIGCIAFGKTTNPLRVNVAFSLVHPGDKFNQITAVKKAVGKLNSDKFCKTFDLSMLEGELGSHKMFEGLGIDFKIMYRVEETQTINAFKGALQNLKEAVKA